MAQKTGISHIKVARVLPGMILCLFFVANCPVYAQEPYSSINTILKNNRFPTPKDTSHIWQLLRYAQEEKYKSPDSALSIFREALAASIPIHYYAGISSSLIGIGACYSMQREYQLAKTIFFQAGPYARLANSGHTMTTYYNALAVIYSLQGVSDSAVYFYYRALNEFNEKKLSDLTLLIRIYGNLGAALSDMGQASQSFYYLNKAKQLALLFKDTRDLPFIFQNTAAVYTTNGKYDSSMVYLLLAKQLNMERGNYIEAQANYYSIGDLFLRWGQNDSAGDPSLRNKNAQCALLYFDSATRLDRVEAQSIPLYQEELGSVYDLLGNHAKALSYFKKALVLSDQDGSLKGRSDIDSALAKLYYDAGQYSLAYQYQKAFSDLKATMMDDEKIKSINQLEVKYRLSEKDKELLQNRFQLYKQKKQVEQRNTWLGVIVFSSYLLITLAFLLYNNKRKLRKIKVQQEERDRIARDLHDGMGVLLSAVKMNYAVLGKHEQLAATETYSDGMQLLNDMRDELRAVAYNMVPEMMVKQSLADAVHILCDRVQKGNNIKIDVQIYGDYTVLGQDLYFSIYRILEELINNSIKYSEATEMLVQLMRYEDKLHITVEDNGKGFDTGKAANGMGLRNLKSRTEKLNGKIQFISQPGMGTSVELEIPYKPK